MNGRYERYLKSNLDFSKLRLKSFVREYSVDIDKAIDMALVEDKLLLAYALEEIRSLKNTVKKLKKQTKKVVDDE